MTKGASQETGHVMTSNQPPVFRTYPHPAPLADDHRAELLREPGFGRVFTRNGASLSSD